MTTHTADDGVRVRIVGRIDASTVADIRIGLQEVVSGAGGGPVLVDLADAEIGDATALGLLVEIRRHARRVGCVLHVVEACPRTSRLIRRARLHGLLLAPRERDAAAAAT